MANLEKYEKIVQKKNWKKLGHEMKHASAENLVLLAQACGTVNEDETYNALVDMMRHADERVQLAAIESLGKVGRPAAATQLSWMAENGKSEAVKTASQRALAGIHERN